MDNLAYGWELRGSPKRFFRRCLKTHAMQISEGVSECTKAAFGKKRSKAKLDARSNHQRMKAVVLLRKLVAAQKLIADQRRLLSIENELLRALVCGLLDHLS